MSPHPPSPEEERRIAHSGALARFAGACARHPWRVIGIWLAIIVALFALQAPFAGQLRDEFRVPGTDFQKATDLIEAEFGAQQGAALRVVLAAPEGERLDTPARRAAIEEIVGIARASQDRINAGEAEAAIDDPLAEGSRTLGQNGRVAFFDVTFDQQAFDLEREDIVDVQDEIRAAAEPAGIQAEFTGEAEQAPPESGASEILGLIAAFLILLVLFRALVPTLIPIIFAIVAVMCAFLLLFLAAALTNFNTVTQILVPMIGLGVGIDYTLFIVTRFRQLLHDGLSPVDAAAAAGATAGRAVIFAGLTVAISITGLVLIGIDFITKLGLGSALGVVTAVALANTLLPAVLSLLGHRVFRGRLGLRPVDESTRGQQRTWIAAWGRFVVRRARIVFPVALIALLVLASPVLGVRLGLADAGTAPKELTTRKAYDLLSSGFGPGFTAPIPVVVDINGDPGIAQRLDEAIRDVPGIREVNPPIYNALSPAEATVAIINTYSAYAPQDAQTDDVVSALRDDVIPRTLEGTDAQAYVSGQNAAFTDIGNVILDGLPWFLLYVIGITTLVMTMAFRSLVIAFKAAVTTLLSALVGFGVLTFVVQEGNALGLIGLDRTGPIESFVPPIAFAILFGLSMDYEVFLMSRIREEHIHGGNTVDAIRDGIAGVGRVIVAASLIMSVVFFAFLLNPDRVAKEFGLLLGIAILTDALIVRMTLVPALLRLLGDRSWAIPRWLDRALPRLTIEPPAETRAAEEARRREPAGMS
ncbi:MAG TPA: MMPL family transporter [Miltoncostaeaceae bacterium]|nr:MMPL family transporter [Miltoncostaeaceae bacterium]